MDTHSDILDILKNCWSGDELEALLDILDLKQHELVPVLRLEVFYREISSQALLDEAERTCLTPAQMNTFLERHKLSLHPRASDMRRRCVEYVQLSLDALGPYFLDTKTDLWKEDGGLSDSQLVKAIEIWEANLKSDRMQGSGQVGGAQSNKRYHDSQEASTSTANQGYISSQPSQDATSTIHDSAKRRRINDDDDSDLDYIDTDADSEDDDFEMVSPYSIEATSERVFARNRAHQITYTVKFSHQWRGKLLTSLFQEFEDMFKNLLRDIRMARDLDDQDLGLVIIRHRDLQTPAVFSLRQWSEITAVKILELLQKLLNSNQSLRLDESFEICIGSIRFPRGGHRVKFINADDAIDKKRSIVPIRNTDDLCMARALAVCFCNKHQVTDELWAAVVESNPPKRGSLLKLVLDEKKCSKTIYDHIRKNSSYQKSLALLILERARIYHAATRALSIQDIPCIERTLQARIVVISTASGNQIIYKGAVEIPEDCPTFFLLHVKDSHFSAITNIKGFYSRKNFCYTCLKPYDHVEEHVCAFSCAVCGSNACSFAGARECDDCHMLCRSEACFVRHKEKKEATQRFPNPQSMCQKKFCCPVCSKIMKVRDRNPKQHVCGEWLCPCCKRYKVGTHLCYQRIPTPRKDKQPKFAFFDFETRQDSIMECQQGYTPSDTDCDICVKKGLTPCPHRSKCTLCVDSTCGKPTHIANFVVCQTACHLCMDEVLESSSKCPGCGSRCSKCEAREDKGNFKTPPCSDTCGQREVIFEGDSTAYDFGKWLFSTSHKDFVVLSHNGKAFDNWFLLEYLISQGITPSDVSFAGSKIMSLTVGKGLNIKLLDSLNFMPMALSALPKAFGLSELAKGYFPHNFNTVAHQNYRGPYPESLFYGPDNMRIAARDQFVAWHSKKVKEGAIFDFRKDMLKYCRADVDILRQACLKFRQLILNVTGQEQESGVDPYDYTTIAGVCMGIFKRKFLKEEWKVLLGDPCDDDESPSGDEATTESSSSDIVEEVESDDDEWLSAKKMGDEMHVYVDGQWVPTDDLTVAKKVFVSSNMAQVPSHGYTYSDQYSKASIIWFKWLEQCHEEETGETLNIQHALNGGEFRVPNSHYKLDGWDPVRKHCYEFHSCLLHGCETCYPKRRNSVRLPRTKQTANELFALTKKKKTFLESLGYTYEAMWYHEYVELQKNCTDFKEFVTNCDIEAERLKPRDAFFGGRTNACKLHYMVKEGEHIKYVDFTSLYP